MELLAVPILSRSSAFSFPHNPVCDAIRISSVFEYLRLFREYSLMVEHEVMFGWRSGYLSICLLVYYGLEREVHCASFPDSCEFCLINSAISWKLERCFSKSDVFVVVSGDDIASPAIRIPSLSVTHLCSR